MKMKIVFPDSSWCIGDRNHKATGLIFSRETKGTYHYIILDGSDEFNELIGREVAIPIASVKFFVMRYKVKPADKEVKEKVESEQKPVKPQPPKLTTPPPKPTLTQTGKVTAKQMLKDIDKSVAQSKSKSRRIDTK